MNKAQTAVALLCCTLPLAGIAEEQTLKGKLVTRIISSSTVETPVEGHHYMAAEYGGVAIFEDGRIANKQFSLLMDNGGAEGDYQGYSTYMFENGDSITLKFTGGWGSGGSGGEYEVLSGTGAYEGVTGSGRFDAINNPWEKANLFNLTLNLKLRDS